MQLADELIKKFDDELNLIALEFNLENEGLIIETCKLNDGSIHLTFKSNAKSPDLPIYILPDEVTPVTHQYRDFVNFINEFVLLDEPLKNFILSRSKFKKAAPIDNQLVEDFDIEVSRLFAEFLPAVENIYFSHSGIAISFFSSEVNKLVIKSLDSVINSSVIKKLEPISASFDNMTTSHRKLFLEESKYSVVNVPILYDTIEKLLNP